MCVLQLDTPMHVRGRKWLWAFLCLCLTRGNGRCMTVCVDRQAGPVCVHARRAHIGSGGWEKAGPGEALQGPQLAPEAAQPPQ